MPRMTLRKKFWLLLACFVAALVAEITVITVSGASIKTESEQLSSTVVPMLDKAHQVKLAVVQVQQWLTDISATRGLDGLDDGFSEAKVNAKQFKELVSALKRIDPTHTAEYDALSRKFSDYYAVGLKMAEAYVAEGPASGNKMMGAFDKVAATLAEQVDSLLEKAQQRAEALVARQQSDIRNAGIAIAVTSLFLIATMVGIVTIFFGVLKTLPAIGEEVRRIAEGDVSDSGFECGRHDELGLVAEGIAKMKGNLRELIEQLGESSGEVRSAAVQLAKLSQETEGSMTRQTSDINAIATAMNEMAVSSTEVASTADDTAGSAASADDEAQEGKRVVGDTITAIRALADNVEQAATAINQLEGESENIGTILEVIREIAEQTNLLALNAAIEAARAGEQGRGFAVVADEVRTLASRTQESTEEIYEMINRLQGSARSAVQIMGKGRTHAQETVEQVNGAGTKLESITGAVQTISGLSREIATSAREQSRVAEAINLNITGINEASGQASENAHDISEATDRLASLASNMQTLVGRFRV